jgi:nicotinamide mononucleotide (NMN) deamidase PncC
MEIEELSKRVAYALMDKKLTLCTAEECTCGLVGASIASQDYAQRWYKGGIVTYTELEASKIFLLNISRQFKVNLHSIKDSILRYLKLI